MLSGRNADYEGVVGGRDHIMECWVERQDMNVHDRACRFFFSLASLLLSVVIRQMLNVI